MDKIRIIEAGNELGLGGTEYAIQLYSKFLNKEFFEVTVIGLRSGGERVKLIQDLGIKVIILHGDLIKFAELLQKTDVLHWHGNGRLNQELFTLIRDNKPKLVIQTNVFGAPEFSPLYETVDYDLFISKMILIRRMDEDRIMQDNYFASKRKVLPYPVDIDQISSLMPSPAKVEQFRQKHNLQNCFIAGRIGRADDAKFDLVTLDGFAAFAKKIPSSRFLLVGATPKIMTHAETLKITDKLIIFENTAELEQLLVYYKILDVFIAASEFGESFGMVIAEAMASGIPVITITTPNRDNAQIEVVDNQKTGLVVEHDAEKIASALFFLYNDQLTRSILSASSIQKIKKEYKADHIVHSLENLIYQHFNKSIIDQYPTLIQDFSPTMIADYNKRCADLWEPAGMALNTNADQD